LAGPLALGFVGYGGPHHFGPALHFGHAETYFLVGNALGKGMVKLLQK
jgi:hypothetical protein